MVMADLTFGDLIVDQIKYIDHRSVALTKAVRAVQSASEIDIVDSGVRCILPGDSIVFTSYGIQKNATDGHPYHTFLRGKAVSIFPRDTPIYFAPKKYRTAEDYRKGYHLKEPEGPIRWYALPEPVAGVYLDSQTDMIAFNWRQLFKHGDLELIQWYLRLDISLPTQRHYRFENLYFEKMIPRYSMPDIIETIQIIHDPRVYINLLVSHTVPNHQQALRDLYREFPVEVQDASLWGFLCNLYNLYYPTEYIWSRTDLKFIEPRNRFEIMDALLGCGLRSPQDQKIFLDAWVQHRDPYDILGVHPIYGGGLTKGARIDQASSSDLQK